MSKNVFVTTIVSFNQLELLNLERDEDVAKKNFVKLFNEWTKTETKLETYEECMDYFEDCLENGDGESEFEDLLIRFDIVPSFE